MSAVTGVALSIFTLTVLAPSAQAACSNDPLRALQTSETLPLGTTYLPDCMALEMVTPPKKYGQETAEVVAFSTDGDRVLFRSLAALANTPGLQLFVGDRYVASRGSQGWVTAATSAPSSARIATGTAGGGSFANSSDLSTWAIFGSTQAQALGYEGQFFSDGLDEPFEPLSPLIAAIDDSGSKVLQFGAGGQAIDAASADLSTVVFPTEFNSTAFLPGDPRNTNDKNRYVVFRDVSGEPSLQLLARDEAGKVWGGRCGTRLGGGGLTQGAISPDGSRIYFSTRPAQPEPSPSEEAEGKYPTCDTSKPLRIMKRSGEGPEIEELLPGGPSEAGDDIYQGASPDGTKVFLVTPRDLAASDLDQSPQACSASVGASKGCDLYLYDSTLPPGERLIQVSAGEDVPGQHEAGKGADVLGSAIAISPEGSHVYFTAQGVLTAADNPTGAVPVAGKPNLYVYERDATHPNGRIAFVVTLAESDSSLLWGIAGSFLNHAYAVPLLGGAQGGDGHLLFFHSAASLTGEDADSGKVDIFRYDSTAGSESLQCVSCASGSPDAEPFDAAAGLTEEIESTRSSNFAERSRWASEDGESVVFATAQPLVPGDEDDALDPYLWRKGELIWLPGDMGRLSQARLQRPLLSADGESVAFTTIKTLLSTDGDTARDAYVVRAGGGFPPPVPPPACDPLSEGACQGPASQPGADPATATESFSGPGNRAEVPKCGKRQVRRRGRCVSKAKPRKRSQRQRRASHERGGHR